MLESIAINRRLHPNIEQPFTVGHLAECLLFYGQVNAVISTVEFEELLRKCGIDLLEQLLSSGVLGLHVNTSHFGSTQTPNTARVSYGAFSLVNYDLAGLIFKTVSKVYGGGYRSQKYTERLIPFIEQYDYKEELFGGFLINERFTTTAFREVVRQVSPDYPIPVDLTFRLHNVKKGYAPEELGTSHTFETETNFNIGEFEKYLDNTGVQGHSKFAVSFMMQAAAAIQDVDVSSHFKSELSSEESSAPIIQKAILNLDQYKANNGEVITQFTEHVVNNCPSVADAIDSGMRSFDDFMDLFEQSQQFREWIRQAPDDSDHASIIHEYMKANEAEAFTDNKLYKALKFLVVSMPIALTPIVLKGQPEVGSNVVNMLVGPAVDSFTDLVFTQFNRWKPNQFVKSNLNAFLKS